MEFRDIVKNRCSIRKYEAKPVPEATINELLEIIGLSVSAINLQPWKIKVVSDQETKEKIFPAAFGQEQVRTCSHLLVLCADVDYPTLITKLDRLMAAAGVPEEMRDGLKKMATGAADGMTPEQRLAWSREQVHIALGNAVNGAYSLGLGACPMTAFEPAKLAQILGLPETLVPTTIVSVGYPAETGAPKLRHPVSDIVV
jgi:nitroreductase / dihydropteridine reductase